MDGKEVFNNRTGLTRDIIRRRIERPMNDENFRKKEVPGYEKFSGQSPEQKKFLREHRLDG